jgi:hypothetical protein
MLCVFGSTYRYVAKLLAKYRNTKFAEAVWGHDVDGVTLGLDSHLIALCPLSRVVIGKPTTTRRALS